MAGFAAPEEVGNLMIALAKGCVAQGYLQGNVPCNEQGKLPQRLQEFTLLIGSILTELWYVFFHHPEE